MYTRDQIEQILFLDIETAGLVKSYEDLSPRMQELWNKKSKRYQRSEEEKLPEELYFEKAGIHAEFGRVVCISCGYLRFEEQGKGPSIKIKSFYGADEKKILEEFGEMVDRFMQKHNRFLCAHNGKEFDFPFIGRRCLINGIPLPEALDVQGKKPWETKFIDTMELWKFGDFKSYTSLDLLAAVFDIPSPKDDIDGSQINEVFWYQNAHERIMTYCEKDVKTTAQVLLKMNGLPTID